MRLVDADALLEQMKHRKEYIGRPSDPVCLVEDAPTVDAVPVKNGQWIPEVTISDAKLMNVMSIIKCSYCGKGWRTDNGASYCSNCGAKMDISREICSKASRR